MAEKQLIKPDYTVEECCKQLNCSHPTIYSLINKGVLESYPVGRGRRIKYESIQALRNSGGQRHGGISYDH